MLRVPVNVRLAFSCVSAAAARRVGEGDFLHLAFADDAERPFSAADVGRAGVRRVGEATAFGDDQAGLPQCEIWAIALTDGSRDRACDPGVSVTRYGERR